MPCSKAYNLCHCLSLRLFVVLTSFSCCNLDIRLCSHPHWDALLPFDRVLLSVLWWKLTRVSLAECSGIAMGWGLPVCTCLEEMNQKVLQLKRILDISQFLPLALYMRKSEKWTDPPKVTQASNQKPEPEPRSPDSQSNIQWCRNNIWNIVSLENVST